jgi:hypothetical protein
MNNEDDNIIRKYEEQGRIIISHCETCSTYGEKVANGVLGMFVDMLVTVVERGQFLFQD